MMKRFVLLAVFVLSVSTAFAQKIQKSEKTSKFMTYVEGADFQGVIFSGDFMNPYMPELLNLQRFTPTLQEVEMAEELLRKDLPNLNAALKYQGDKYGPIIHQHLPAYARQYFGYLDEKGERIIFVSCLSKAGTSNWTKGAVLMMNGGSNFFQVRAHTTSKQLFKLDINDLAEEISRL